MWVRANKPHRIFRQFRVPVLLANRLLTVADSIIKICGSSIPPKIIVKIIGRVVVCMKCFHSWRASTHEGIEHENMDVLFITDTEMDNQMPAALWFRTQDSTAAKLRRTV